MIPVDTCVLTKTLAEFLSGKNRMNAFLHVEVRMKKFEFDDLKSHNINFFVV
jgi:hypothetical protein